MQQSHRYDVFISFNQKDKRISDEVYDYLTKHGLRVWKFDRTARDAGYYPSVQQKAVRESTIFLCLFSSNLLHSRDCEAELAMAWECDKAAVFMRLDDTPYEAHDAFTIYRSRVDIKYPDERSLDDALAKLLHLVQSTIQQSTTSPLAGSRFMQRDLHDGRHFVRHFNGTNLPAALRLDRTSIPRNAVVSELKSQCAGSGAVVVHGIELSGKSHVISQFLQSRDTYSWLSSIFGTSWISILVLNCQGRIGGYALFRALAEALSADASSMPEDIWISAPHDIEQDRKADLIQRLSRFIGSSQPIVVVEKSHDSKMDDQARAQLKEILALPALRNALLIFESRELHTPPVNIAKCTLRRPIEIGTMSVDEAAKLIHAVDDQDFDRSKIIDALGPVQEFLYPGVLNIALSLYNVSHGEDTGNARIERLVSCVLHATELTLDDSEVGLLKTTTDEVVADRELIHLLTCLALTDDVPIDQSSVTAFNPAIATRLEQQGLIHHVPGGYVLCDYLRAVLRNRLKRWFQDASSSSYNDSFLDYARGFITELASHLESVEGLPVLKERIEEFLVWAGDAIDHARPFRSLLLQVVVQLSTEDSFLPVDSDQAEVLLSETELSAKQALDPALTRLALTLRMDYEGKRIAGVLDEAISIAAKARLSSYSLYLIDALSVSACNRYHISESGLASRLLLNQSIDAQCKLADSTDIDVELWLIRAVNWYLNNSRLASQHGDWLVAVDSIRKSESHLDALHNFVSSSEPKVNWLRANVILQKVQLSFDNDERRLLLEAMLQNMAASWDGQTRHLTKLLTLHLSAARLLASLYSSDSDKQKLTTLMRSRIETLIGPIEIWDVNTVAILAAFVREVASVMIDLDLQLSLAQEACDMLRKVQSDIVQNVSYGDSRAALVWARCWRFLGLRWYDKEELSRTDDCFKRAERIVDDILKKNPTADAWLLRLRLAQQVPGFVLMTAYQEDIAFGLDDIRVSNVLPIIRRCEQWLKTRSAWGAAEGRLLLACFVASGDMRYSIASKMKGDGYEAFMGLPKEEKAKAIKAEYNRRRRTLDAIQKKVGLSFESVRTRIWLELDFQRMQTLELKEPYDLSIVLELLGKMRESWPSDLQVPIYSAGLASYLWDFDEAASVYRTVLPRLALGQDRRKVITAYASTLLRAVLYGKTVDLSTDTEATHDELLKEAKRLLEDECFATGSLPKRVVILRDRVRLERYKEIDWDKINDTFQLVVGGIEQYLATVSENLTQIRAVANESIDHAYSLVRTNCTDVSGLHELGHLYLRAAVLLPNVDKLQCCERAFACFDACRVLQQSFYGKEHPVITYLKALSISTAISIALRIDAIAVKTENDLPKLGDRLFQSALSRSVGAFHDEIARRKGEFDKLLLNLGYKRK